MPGNALISDGIRDILVAASIGVFQPDALDTDWVISISRMRDKPNKMICVYDSTSLAPEPGLDIDYPGIQIVVRGEPDGYKDAFNKARRIKDALLGMPRTEINGDIWASVTMLGDILPLGYDDSERPEMSMNFQLIVHQGDLTNSYREDSA
jgi:Bacteriophage minor capsid protein